jgi:hypothetical protein
MWCTADIGVLEQRRGRERKRDVGFVLDGKERRFYFH